MPPISALPYPFDATDTTRAPKFEAKSVEPSVLPLSAMMISPAILESLRKRCAFWMHVATVSASFKHGITMESSTCAPRSFMFGSAGNPPTLREKAANCQPSLKLDAAAHFRDSPVMKPFSLLSVGLLGLATAVIAADKKAPEPHPVTATF